MKEKVKLSYIIICLLISFSLLACSEKGSPALEDTKSISEQSESLSTADEPASVLQLENTEAESSEDSKAKDSREESLSNEIKEETAAVETQEGYLKIGGTWKVGGIYYEGHLIDINDIDAIKSMYDTTMITFNEDGSFVYLKKYNDRGMWSIKRQGSGDCFILKTESNFVYEMQNGSLAEKEMETSNKKLYIVALLDENTFVLNEYDSITGKAKANDDPYIFVKQGESSKYIADNKTPINNSERSQSKTEETSPQPNSVDSSNATSGEKNALSKALQYLNYSAFSYSGLVDQLEYEGYSSSEATYAADHCGANWKEQAVEKALSYLDYSAFSYNGLVEQLEYEGFSSSEAQYGVDNCGADWNEQAAKKAKEYLQYSSFSRSELINQLVFEGFTQAQAEYGVNIVY